MGHRTRVREKEPPMKKTIAVSAVLATAIAALAAAQTPSPAPAAGVAPPKPASLGLRVYPGKGQDGAKRGTEGGGCYPGAGGQTGIAPPAAPAQAAAVEPQRGGAVKGAARGAARGAAVGA